MARPWRSPPERPRDRGVRRQHRRREAHLLGHQPLGDAPHLGDVEEPAAVADGAADEDVAPERLLVGQRALLVDGLDAQRAGLLDRQAGDGLRR